VVSTTDASGQSGAAYIYAKGGAGFGPKIPTVTVVDPHATNGDRFGFALTMSGATLLVDAVNADDHQSGGTECGVVSLFHA
jgi:hypothetical protein